MNLTELSVVFEKIFNGQGIPNPFFILRYIYIL